MPGPTVPHEGSSRNIDDAYYRAHLPVIDERLALGGVRLAAVLNRIFVAAP